MTPTDWTLVSAKMESVDGNRNMYMHLRSQADIAILAWTPAELNLSLVNPSSPPSLASGLDPNCYMSTGLCNSLTP